MGDALASGTTTSTPPFQLTHDSVVSWVWLTQYMIQAQPQGAGTVSPTSAWAAEGTNLTITATAAPYYHLEGWTGATGGCVAVGTNITVPADSPRTLTASFAMNLTANHVPVPEHPTERVSVRNPIHAYFPPLV